MKPRYMFMSLLVAGIAAAQQADDLFSFIPPGGRTLLEQALADGDPSLSESLASARTSTEWLERLSAPDSKTGAALDDWGRQTLADYLSYAGPIRALTELPADGRDIMLERCQSCHIITVTVTQARSREAWLATLGRTSHVEIPISEAERNQLADYLAVNAGLPIDVIPPELRAGGASY